MTGDDADLQQYLEEQDSEFDPADRVAKLKKVRDDPSGVMVVSRSRYRGQHPVYVDGVAVHPAGEKRYTCADHEWEETLPVVRHETKCCESKDKLRVEAAGISTTRRI